MKYDILSVALFFFLLIGFMAYQSGKGNDSIREQEISHFCEMRDIYRDSQGEYGWPQGAHSKFNDGECVK